MNSQEKRIARGIKAMFRRVARGNPHAFGDLAKVEHIHVKLHADGVTYDYVSGPELMNVGAPARRRKVWSVRFGCNVEDSCARGGYAWKLTRDEAVAAIRKDGAS